MGGCYHPPYGLDPDFNLIAAVEEAGFTLDLEKNLMCHSECKVAFNWGRETGGRELWFLVESGR